MALRLFADHCVPSSIIELLKNAGHHGFVLKDHIPRNSADRDVIDAYRQLDAILITLNGDFADLTAYPPAQYKGIIALQIKNHPEIIPELMQRLDDYFAQYLEMEYYKGKLFIVEIHRIRIRK